ncbi:MAG: caspase family protein [Opitutales bacterium]|nr:caspase family protein [Opitutales bacterium]
MTTDTDRRDKVYALVIGLGRYADPQVTPLKYTRNDAQAFADILTDPAHCGLAKENVHVLLDEKATLYAIKDGISNWLASATDDDATAFVFFAGHGGVEVDRTQRDADRFSTYLLPYDTNPQNLFASALAKEVFERLLRTLRARRTVVLLDACHAGGVIPEGGRNVAVHYGGDLYASIAEGAGSLLIASAQPDQLSWEDDSLGHGIFTHHLLEALRGGADHDNDGRVSLTDVYRHLQTNVPKTSRRLGRTVQEPVFKGSYSRDIVLAVNPRRILEARLESEEAEKRRREQLWTFREALFRLHKENGLSTDAFNELNTLAESDPETLSDTNRRILELAHALVAGAISVDVFHDSRAAFKAHAQASTPRPQASAPVNPAHTGPAPAKQTTPPRRATGPSSPPQHTGIKTAKPPESSAGLVLLALIVPLVGLVVGVILLAANAESNRGRAILCIVFSVVNLLACLFLLLVVTVAFDELNGLYYDTYP